MAQYSMAQLSAPTSLNTMGARSSLSPDTLSTTLKRRTDSTVQFKPWDTRGRSTSHWFRVQGEEGGPRPP